MLALAAISCEASVPACRFGAEYRLFQSQSQMFHDLRTVQLGGGMLALFSDASGVHAQPLDARGAPNGERRRLFEACEGGIDADSGDAEIHVACLRRGGEEETAVHGHVHVHGHVGEESERVTLYALEPGLGVRELQRFGRAGRISTGIALARAGDEMVVAWHDAAVSGGRIWYFAPGRMPEPRQLSESGWEASAPSLVWNGAQPYAAWAETRFVGEKAESRILVAKLGAPAHVVLGSKDPSPSPKLALTPQGLILSFRDKRESLRKTGLYLARLDPGGRLSGQVVRAGRADGQASPVLEPCLGGVVSATPRTFAGDYFVGVMRADPELRRLSAEQQFYEDSREFDRVAVHCVNDRAVLLIGERGRLLRGSAALRSTTFHCD